MNVLYHGMQKNSMSCFVSLKNGKRVRMKLQTKLLVSTSHESLQKTTDQNAFGTRRDPQWAMLSGSNVLKQATPGSNVVEATQSTTSTLVASNSLICHEIRSGTRIWSMEQAVHGVLGLTEAPLAPANVVDASEEFQL